MSETFSPKQVARAIGVSESSLKRWCDRGLIPTICTAGGHRRLPIQGVLEFIKSTQRTLVQPEALGLPSPLGGRRPTLETLSTELVERLVAGDEAGSRRLILDAFLDNHRIAAIGDQLLRPAFEQIGRLWECGQVEVYRERVACRICVRVMEEMHRLAPTPPADAPLALGAAPSGDWYELPGTLVELVIRQNGLRAVSLGSNLPVETLTKAILVQRPALFWLSVSHLADRQSFIESVPQIVSVLGPDAKLIIGGRAIDNELLASLSGIRYGRSLAELEDYLKTLVGQPIVTAESDTSSN